MNCVEALSAFTDTVYDEVNAPHWKKKQEEVNGEDKAQIEEIYEDVKEIKEDPESWAESQSFELDEENEVEVEEKLGDEGTRLSALEETRALTRSYLISKSKVGG